MVNIIPHLMGEIFPTDIRQSTEQIIYPDSDFGLLLGFTSANFTMASFLAVSEEEKVIYIPCIQSQKKRKGYLKSLVSKILSLGYAVVIWTPSPIMEIFCLKYGFFHFFEYVPEMRDFAEGYVREGNFND